MKTSELKRNKPDTPYTKDITESRRHTPKTPRTTTATTPAGKPSRIQMKKKKHEEERKMKTSMMNWMRNETLDRKEETELTGTYIVRRPLMTER